MRVKHYKDNRTENRTQEPIKKGRIIFLAVRIFLLALVQVSVVSRIGFFGATPDILLSFIIVLSVTGRGRERWREISLTGLALGFLLDALGGVGIGLSALFYFLIGAAAPNLIHRTHRSIFEELLFFYAVLIPSALLGGVVTLLSVLLSVQGGFSFTVCLRTVLLPEFFGTLVFAFPIFFLFRRWRS